MPRKPMAALTDSMFYVLMAFQNDEMCGIDVAEFIEQHTDSRIKLGPATLYTILAKFEKEKYIREINVEGRKRTYIITEKGRSAYEAELSRLRQCITDAERLTERSEKKHEQTTQTSENMLPACPVPVL